MSRWKPALVLIVAAVAVGVAAVLWRPSPPPAPPEPASDHAGNPGSDGPNVLLIVWDTTRADRMSLYGHDVPTTPRLDAWAAQNATVYEAAQSAATWTLPAHSSLFTGLPVTTHGAHAGWKWLDHHHDTLAETLGAAGYGTYVFSANPWMSPMANALQGFERVEMAWSPRFKRTCRDATHSKLLDHDKSTEISPAYESGDPDIAWQRSTFKDCAPVAGQALMQWIDTQSGPWFAYLNLMEAHTPRIPSLEARRKVMSEELVELGLATDVSLFREVSYVVGEHHYTERELAAIRGVYDATLTELDMATVDLLEKMKTRGLLEDTVVILTSDHGENLGDHQLFEHRWSIWQTLLHVPLVVYAPDALAVGRVSEPVSTAQIHDTILDLTGVSDHVPSSLIGGAPPEVVSELRDPYASKLMPIREAYPEMDVSAFLRTWEAYRAGPYKLSVPSDGDPALYDLSTDTSESVNLAETDPERLKALHDGLTAWQKAQSSYDPAKRTRRDKPKGAEDEEVRAQLEMLGYVE